MWPIHAICLKKKCNRFQYFLEKTVAYVQLFIIFLSLMKDTKSKIKQKTDFSSFP